ncbi:MAG TPA: hypothetical protein DCM05_00230, partial [Elusimicrobia bacterium]|nr:hypothetical protein [Elusimicrobiota bacterium]
MSRSLRIDKRGKAGCGPLREDRPDVWRSAFQALIRRAGLLQSEGTPCGMPISVSHAHALLELSRQTDLTQNGLAELLGLTKSAVSRLVERLERLGHVSRRDDSGDRRARRLRLTAKGSRLAEKVNARSLRRFSILLDGIPRARRSAVLESLELLREALPAPHGKAS